MRLIIQKGYDVEIYGFCEKILLVVSMIKKKLTLLPKMELTRVDSPPIRLLLGRRLDDCK